MKFLLSSLLVLIFLGHANIYAEDPPGIKETGTMDSIRLPVNLYDTFSFSERISPYARTATWLSGPAIMTAYGLFLWDWGRQMDFALQPETYKGAHAVNGAADKYGHAYVNYAGQRLFAFLFRASGSSKNRANIEGALLMEFSSLLCEVGDGFSPHYGADPYDILFNQYGIILGMILNHFPLLDGIFTFQWEYFPSSRIRSNLTRTDRWDISTDYNDSKYILVTKLGGVPYLSLTPLRYVNIDFGYYTRGYRHANEYSSRTRNMFIGLSFNFTIGIGDLLPVGYISSTLQSVFNYYHPPIGWEVKKWVISDVPHSEFE